MLIPAEPLPGVAHERIQVDRFDPLTMRFVLPVHTTAPSGLPDLNPVGRAIAGPAKTGRLYQGFQ